LVINVQRSLWQRVEHHQKMPTFSTVWLPATVETPSRSSAGLWPARAEGSNGVATTGDAAAAGAAGAAGHPCLPGSTPSRHHALDRSPTRTGPPSPSSGGRPLPFACVGPQRVAPNSHGAFKVTLALADRSQVPVFMCPCRRPLPPPVAPGGDVLPARRLDWAHLPFAHLLCTSDLLIPRL